MGRVPRRSVLRHFGEVGDAGKVIQHRSDQGEPVLAQMFLGSHDHDRIEESIHGGTKCSNAFQCLRILTLSAKGFHLRSELECAGVELPLILSDHADWDELTATIREVEPREVWVTHGREEALVRWCGLAGIPAKPLHMVGYDEDEDA